MKSVGVKTLKAKLSAYLQLVKAGETVLVTDRDEVIAELRPSHRQDRSDHSVEDILDGLAEHGSLTRSSDDSRQWPFSKLPSVDLPVTSAEVLDQLRKERY